MRSAVKKAVSAIRTFLINGFSKNAAEKFFTKRQIPKITKVLLHFSESITSTSVFLTFPTSFVNQGFPSNNIEPFPTLMRAILVSSAPW